MSLVPSYPFWDLNRFFEEEPEWPRWPEIWGGPRWRRFPFVQTPRMDVYETNGEIVAEAELPGVDPKNIEVEVKNNILKIEAKAEEKKEEKGKGYYRKELSRGYYKRSFPLPVEVVGEKAEASYQEGILKVVIPKVMPKEKEKERKIKVKVKTKIS